MCPSIVSLTPADWSVVQVRKVKKHEHSSTVLCSSSDRRILFHPKSVLAPCVRFPYPWVVYHVKQKSTQVAEVVVVVVVVFYWLNY